MRGSSCQTRSKATDPGPRLPRRGPRLAERVIARNLPHSSSAQYGVVRHIPQGDKQPGDLIFMHSGSDIYHVAIYAGDGMMWAATHTGDIVRKERIYTSSYYVGRA